MPASWVADASQTVIADQLATEMHSVDFASSGAMATFSAWTPATPTLAQVKDAEAGLCGPPDWRRRAGLQNPQAPAGSSNGGGSDSSGLLLRGSWLGHY